MNKHRLLLLILLVAILLFIFVRPDTLRHPVTGTLDQKFQDSQGLHFVVLEDNGNYFDIYPVPKIVYDTHEVGENVSFMVRGHTYRFEDIR